MTSTYLKIQHPCKLQNEKIESSCGTVLSKAGEGLTEPPVKGYG